jgi:hypothetical protein
MLGQTQQAQQAAGLALAAARAILSGFRYRQHVGLVKDTNDLFAKRLAALAVFMD